MRGVAYYRNVFFSLVSSYMPVMVKSIASISNALEPFKVPTGFFNTSSGMEVNCWAINKNLSPLKSISGVSFLISMLGFTFTLVRGTNKRVAS